MGEQREQREPVEQGEVGGGACGVVGGGYMDYAKYLRLDSCELPVNAGRLRQEKNLDHVSF